MFAFYSRSLVYGSNSYSQKRMQEARFHLHHVPRGPTTPFLVVLHPAHLEGRSRQLQTDLEGYATSGVVQLCGNGKLAESYLGCLIAVTERRGERDQFVILMAMTG